MYNKIALGFFPLYPLFLILQIFPQSLITKKEKNVLEAAVMMQKSQPTGAIAKRDVMREYKNGWMA